MRLLLAEVWFWLSWTVSLLSAGHALLNKRDPRAALGWIVVCLALPGYGAFLYWLLGVNRIQSRARTWVSERQLPLAETCELERKYAVHLTDQQLPGNFRGLFRLGNHVSRQTLLSGNRVRALYNGEQAFPPMLAAIDRAERSIELSTYLFENNESGRQFAAALQRAADRGVQVRVLLDALGERYSFPTIARRLRHPRLRYARFLPLSLSGRGFYFNLRNHGKLLVVDNRLGFTGGMNIGDSHLVLKPPRGKRTVDLHFQVEGPVVGHLRQSFAENWFFATGERLPDVGLLPEPVGTALCRGISGGPDEGFQNLYWILIGALQCARERVRIMTPYFIPDRALIIAINAAAMRGVKVELLLPARNNLPLVHWACRSYLWELVSFGVEVWMQPPPFVHSKLLLVDESLALVGSANLDPRSLRLNFEFNLGVYDRELTTELAAHFDTSREVSRRVTMAELDGRPLPVKLRDAAAKLLSPYL